MNRKFLLTIGTLFLISIYVVIASPYQEVKSFKFDHTALSRKNIEKKLGRKLKLKERISLWLLRRQLKKTHDLIEVQVDLMSGTRISGKFFKVENDSIYLLDSSLRSVDIYNPPSFSNVVGLNEIDMIRKRPAKPLGIVILAGLLAWGGLIAFGPGGPSSPMSNTGLGCAALGLSLVLAIFSFILATPRKIFIKGKPSKSILKKLRKFLPIERIKEKQG